MTQKDFWRVGDRSGHGARGDRRFTEVLTVSAVRGMNPAHAVITPVCI